MLCALEVVENNTPILEARTMILVNDYEVKKVGGYLLIEVVSIERLICRKIDVAVFVEVAPPLNFASRLAEWLKVPAVCVIAKNNPVAKKKNTMNCF